LPGCSALELVLAALGLMKAGPQDQQTPLIPHLHKITEAFVHPTDDA